MCVMLAAASSVFAASLFQFGGSATYAASDVMEEKKIDVDRFSFGAEARFNPSGWFSFVMPVSVTFGEDKSLDMAPSANINLPVNTWLDVAGGVGLSGKLYDGGFLGQGPWKENIKAMLPFCRLALSFNLGRLSLSLAGEIPFENNVGELLNDLSFSPDLGGTTLRMSALFNFN